MNDNQRRLLPYEYQLIEALGITKDQYLDFVAQQHIYEDEKIGTIFDVRNGLEVYAIVLTIIGILFQVASIFLMPKPSIPQMNGAAGQRQQTRDDIFAPRFGFNTTQSLARYGDPVHLIYTNSDTNPNGGVRVATSLLWSSVKSFGSSQYVQLLLLLGAGGIGAIDSTRTAFGQTPIRDLIAQNYWLYFRANSTGFIRGVDLVAGGNGESDPAAVNVGTRNLYRISPSSPSSAGDGFSHALSPATSNKFGVYAPVPLNVNIIIRNEAGAEEAAINGVSVSSLSGWGDSSPLAVNKPIPVGATMIITLASTATALPTVVEEEAADQRRALSSAFDNAGIFKLGSAKFSVISSNRGSTDEGAMTVTLQCIEAGVAPSAPYASLTAKDNAQQLANADPNYITSKRITEALLNEDERERANTIFGPGIYVDGQSLPLITTAAQLLADGRIYAYATQTNVPVGNARGGGTIFGTRVVLVFKRNLTQSEKASLATYIDFQDAIASGSRADDTFFNKALVKVEKASYETVSPCHIIDFALKARVLRRISGRQEKYGSKEYPGYPISDNGIKLRSSMFLVKYKKASDVEFTYVKGIFIVRRAADNDNFIYFRFNSGTIGADNAIHWHFEMEPIHDSIAEFKSRVLSVDSTYHFFYLENSGAAQTIALGEGSSISFVGSIESSTNMLPPRNNSPSVTNEWDLFSNTADTQLQFSFDNGPEFTLTAVTEQIQESFSNLPELYNDLSLVGFNLYSGRSVQDLRSLSMFVTKGRQSRLLRTSGTVDGIAWGQADYQYLSPIVNGYANTAPDIFVDTVLDNNDGIGKYAGDLFSVDLEELARSKKFCETNKLFMDGIIAEPSSWREFWALNASFSLLELAKHDGRETLLPAVPYSRDTGAITRAITISALFNQGNILEESYKEEFIDYGSSTEDIIATVIYRQNEKDGVFPRNNSVEVKLTDTSDVNALRETIDLSAFVANKEQAILVGKFLCQIKRHSRRAIEFKTFPTDSFIAPGGYIYVELSQNQWNNIQTGTIGEDGALNLPFNGSINDGSYQCLLYNPNATISGTVFKSGIAVVGNRAASLTGFKDYVFVLGTAIRNQRVFRVTEVSMDEEGEVTVRGVEHPTDADGQSLISNGLATRVPGLFTIDNRPE